MKGAVRAHWGSRMAFVLAAAGSAIGLGNIWKFPYVAGVNGGGLFVLIYIFCILLVGIPVFIAELYIGQQGQKNVVESFEVLDKKRTVWSFPGYLGLVSAFFILSFYSVVGGWVLDFEYRSLMFQFSGMNHKDVGEILNSLFSNPLRQTFWHFCFVLLSGSVVWAGVSKGLERFNKVLMPSLLVILLGLLGYSFTLPGFSKALDFLFFPHATDISASSILEAVGHSFFTLSLGMGAILTYGSYLSKKESLSRVAFTVAFLDTTIALIAGMIIFSIVFSFDLEPAAGPGLIFATLPSLFVQLPGGSILSILFFLLVTFAALTSAVSILEVVVAFWTERFNTSRHKTTLVVALVVFLFGLPSVFSTNIMSDVKMFGLTFFDLFDKLTSSYFLPIGGLLISLFYGWKLGPKAIEKTFGGPIKFWSTGLLWLTRVVAPLAIFLVLYNMAVGF
tara:strand:- start:293 stop:1636 length:1344 start_codon:yes stop_codon:yes gene_type:complete